MYLVRSARWDDPARLRGQPELWRRVRRFNLPVQLAVAAAEEVAAAAQDPAAAALLSLAPCHSGSPDLFAATLALAGSNQRREEVGSATSPVRVNPVVTLHAVDNLALSALAIAFGNRAYGLGLGGAPGQAWVALEIAHERFVDGRDSEILVVAGDQDVPAGNSAAAVALLFSKHGGQRLGPGPTWRLAHIKRFPEPYEGVEPHAAAGLVGLLDALACASKPRLDYRVPGAHGDGNDQIELQWEVA